MKPKLSKPNNDSSFLQLIEKYYPQIGAGVVLSLVVLLGVLWVLLSRVNPEAITSTPAKFVGRSSCIECHQQQADLFHGSHHDLAMDVANETTVRANFDNQSLTHFGVTSTFFKRDDKFFVNTEGPNGEMRDFEIKYVFGYEPLQQYMVELNRAAHLEEDEVGQVQVLRLCWDTIGKRWFYLTPPDVKEKLEPDDPLHWTGITMRWNTSCADCHSTNLKKNFDAITKTFSTTFSEIDVSCEACHGPGSHHVELERHRSWFNNPKETGLVSLKTADAKTQIEMCATCHSRRLKLSDGFTATCSFDDYFACELLMDHTYHGDGQIKDEVYVYGSFVQSKMYHEGIRCTDCHDPHSAKVKKLGNDLCTSCHAHPAGKYDTPLHHHHQIGSTGSLCVECHMPATTYMEVDPRRDHSLRVPRPDLSVKFGVPNACTGCHLDSTKLPEDSQVGIKQYLDWITRAEDGDEIVKAELERVNALMDDAVKSWFPTPHYDDSHYYARLAASSIESEEMEQILIALMDSPAAPSITRATAAIRTLEFRSDETLRAALNILNTRDARAIVGAFPRIESAMNRQIDYLRYTNSRKEPIEKIRRYASAVANFLTFESLEVRLAACRTLAGIPLEIRSDVLSGQQIQEFETARDEYLESLKVENDRAASWAVISTLKLSDNDLNGAIEAIRRAISLDESTSGLRSQLASLLSQQTQNIQQDARQQAQEGNTSNLQQLQERMVELLTEISELRERDHELILVELKRAEGFPGAHHLYYRVAMSYYLRGETDLTLQYLNQAIELEPDNEIYLLALATFYKSQGDWQKTSEYVDRLLQQDPEHPGYKLLEDEADQNVTSELP